MMPKKFLFVLTLILVILYPGQVGLYSQEKLIDGKLYVKGVVLNVTPSQQTVPINTPTIVATDFSVENAELLGGMTVKGTLQGPGLAGSITLTTVPNQPFSIPGLLTKGTYTLDNIHLEKNGVPMIDANPSSVTIEVMDIIITKVESRPLTLAEIREKGINISSKNFTVYNFSVGIMVESKEVKYEFPVVYSGTKPYIPELGGTGSSPDLKSPVGNGGSVPFVLEIPELELPPSLEGSTAESPKIPGVLIFNNDVAFLNQFFSVMFIISNNAPSGSPLTLKNVSAQITFPDGLREAETNPPHLMGAAIPVHCPGPDNKIGTADDIEIILATFSGMAEFLAEGLKQGTHVVKVDFNGTLSGLPSGDVPIEGTASGAVIVRNPKFSISFAHPSVIRVDEKYDIRVTLTNTSPVPANLVSFTMPSTRIYGARLISDETASFETILPGESVDCTFKMIAMKTGQVTATALEMDGGLQGKFVLTTGVGESGIPLSPDSLVLPDYAYNLPPELINPALSALGEAYSLAKTPAGGIPAGLPSITAAVVKQRVIELAEAGQQLSFGDPLLNAVQSLALDWVGNRFQDINFDMLRRLTSKGITFAEAQAEIFNTGLVSQSITDFQEEFARNCSDKNPFFSAALNPGTYSGSAPAAHLTVKDYLLNSLSKNGTDYVRDIPYGEFYSLKFQDGSPADFILVGNVDQNGYTVEVTGEADGRFDLSLIVPDTTGNLRQVVFYSIPCKNGSRARITVKPSDTSFVLSNDLDGNGTTTTNTGTVKAIVKPSLKLIGAIQDCSVDKAGHVVALFFNRAISPETAKIAENYSIDGMETYAAFRQSSGRVVLVGFDNPISPFVEKNITVTNIKSIDGQLITPVVTQMPIKATIKTPGGIVFGKVLTADSKPLSGVTVQLREIEEGEMSSRGDSAATYSFTKTDSSGNYQFDFVRMLSTPFDLTVVDPGTGKMERITARVRANAQRLEIDIIMRGRGSISGTVLNPDLTRASGAYVTAVAENQTPGEYFEARCNSSGEFVLSDVPLGRIRINASSGSISGSVDATLSSPGEILPISITLRGIQTGSIIGQVFKNDGVTPVASTDISLSQDGLYLMHTITDSGGSFQFLQVPIGTVSIKALNPDTLSYETPVNTQVQANQTSSVTVILRGTGKISGIVRSNNGDPRAGVIVFISNTGFYTTTGTDGRFTLENIPIGKYTVIAHDNSTGDHLSNTAYIYYEGQEAFVEFRFPLNLKGGITGLVKDIDGSLLPDADILLANSNYTIVATTHSGSGTDQPRGTYSFSEIPVGNYKVIVVKAGYAGVSDTVVQSLRNTSCDVLLRGKGKIKLEVMNSNNTAGVMADVTLNHSVFEYEPGDFIGFRGSESTYKTDSDGLLTINDVTVGSFSIKASNAFYPQGAAKSGTISSNGQEVAVKLQMTPTGKVTVKVVSVDGVTPVKNARLKFISTITIDGVETDDNGEYTFTLIPIGDFTIEAEDLVNGYKGRLFGYMSREDTENPMAVTLRLTGKGKVSVLVKDFAKNPVTNFSGTMVLRHIGYPTQIITNTQPVNGVFSFENIFAGQFSLTVYDSSRLNGGSASGILYHGEEKSMDIYLNPWGTISGHVIYPSTLAPVPNAQVILVSVTTGETTGYYTSADDGSFLFEFVPIGSYTLDVFDPASGRRGKNSASLTANSTASQVDVYLDGRGKVSGTFYNGSGIEVIENAEVTLKSSGKFPYEMVTTTDIGGNFAFDSVGEGSFTLSALQPGTVLSGSAEGAISYDGQHAIVDIFAHPAGIVTGRVLKVDGQEPEGNAYVSLKIVTTVLSTLSNNDPAAGDIGTYKFQQVPIGSFTVTARQNGGRYAGSSSGQLQYHGEEANIDVVYNPLGKVSGRVLSAGGSPEAQITVTLTSGSESFTTISDDNGYYEFNMIRMGVLSIQTIPRPNTNLSSSWSGDLQNTELTVDLTLAPAGKVQGIVLGSDGLTPVSSAYITLTRGSSRFYTSTVNDGSFHFDGVQLGEFKLDIQGPYNSGKARIYSSIDTDGQVIDAGNIVLDIQSPSVTGFEPLNGSTMVSLDSSHPVKIYFSEKIDVHTVSKDTLFLTSGGVKLTGTYRLLSDETTVEFTPTGVAASLALYTLTITTSVEDANGNPLGSVVSGSFTTRDNVPPSVVSVSPLNNATGIMQDSVISVTFNEPVNNAAFNNQNLTLKKGTTLSSAVEITGAITFNENKTTAYLTPSALEANMCYWIVVKGQSDYSGNINAQEFSSRFYTVDTVKPTIISLASSQNPVFEGASLIIRIASPSNDIASVYLYLNDVLKSTNVDYYNFDGTNYIYRYVFNAPTIAQNGGNSLLFKVKALDKAGNWSDDKFLTVTLKEDAFPVITITNNTGTTVLPGAEMSFLVNARDDIQLTNVTFHAYTLATSTAPQGDLLNITRTEASAGSSTFNFKELVPLTPDILGRDIEVYAEAEDSGAHVSRTAPIVIHVPADTQSPAVAFTQPDAGAFIEFNSVFSIALNVTDDTRISKVELYIDNELISTLTTSPYQSEYTHQRNLTADTDVIIRAVATDMTGKQGTAERTVVFKMTPSASVPPTVKVLTPTNGSLVFPGENLLIRVIAEAITSEENPSNSVKTVRFYAGDTLIGTDDTSPYEITYTIPETSNPGDIITFKAEAEDAVEAKGYAITRTGVVTGIIVPVGTTINASNAADYDNNTIIIRGDSAGIGEVRIDGSHTFTNILVKEKGKLTHTVASTTAEYKMNLTVTGKTVIGPNASIDVTGRGYLGGRQGDNTSSKGRTLNNDLTGGSDYGSGGSYGGYGGRWIANTIYYAVNEGYGSPYDPSYPGSGGGTESIATGGNGGGVIRIASPALILDGKIISNGTPTDTTGGGSGGSIRIDAQDILGNGYLQANGGSSNKRCGGGGGRIALFYNNIDSTISNDIASHISVLGGISSYTPVNPGNSGGSGTIYLEKTGNPGELIISNTSSSNSRTPLITTPSGTITSIEDGVLTDANAVFIPGSFAGMLLQPNVDNSKTFKIITNTVNTIQVEYTTGDGMTLYANIGDRYKVKYPSKLSVENARLSIKGNATVPDLTMENTVMILDGELNADSLTLNSGSLISHSPSSTTSTSSLHLVVGDLHIDSTSSIDVSGKGYMGAFQPEPDKNTYSDAARTYLNTKIKSSTSYSGGSYGGMGGKDVSTAWVNLSYGSISNPTDPGSGGSGTSIGLAGTNGGGVIRIDADTLSLYGNIKADGINSSSAVGTGSGGSVLIHTSKLEGNGLISAGGGNSVLNYGAGGGGRIALYYSDGNGFDFSKITAYGGKSGNGSSSLNNGFAGTVYLKLENEEARLLIDNRGLVAANPIVFPKIYMSKNTSISNNILEDTTIYFMPDSLIGMKLIPDAAYPETSYSIIDNDSTTITVDRNITGVQTGSFYKVVNVFGGHLQIVNNTIAEIHGDVELINLSVLTSSKLRHPGCTKNTESYLSIHAQEKVTVDSTSSIDVSDLGYLGGLRGDNSSIFPLTINNTYSNGTATIQRTGGGYGGLGGKYGTDPYNGTYGSLYQPVFPGSGGGYALVGDSKCCGGNGGGVIRIEAAELHVDGNLYSNGGSPRKYTDQNSIAFYGGGGSGGSIWIRVDVLMGSGLIKANGADTQYNGAGGGGRIALYYNDATGFNLDNISSSGGKDSFVWSPPTPRANGAAGTVFIKKDTDELGALTIDNKGVETETISGATTPLPAVGQGIFTTLEANRMEVSTSLFSPGALTGMKLDPFKTGTNLFSIISNTDKIIYTLEEMTSTSQYNGTYIGEHRFLNLTVKGKASLSTTDRVVVTGTLTVETGSTFTAENHQ